MGLIIDSFTSRPSEKQWSLISWLHRDPLQGNGHRFLTLRPSPLEWSIILNIASRPSTWDWSSIPLHQGPLKSNGHWFLGCIESLYKAMVIDFLHQGPLLWNGHWFSTLHRDPLHGTSHRFLYIKALCKAMFIDFLVALRPSARQWSSISYIKALSFGMVIDSQHCIETLYMGLVIDSFTSRPFAKQWSLISWLHWDPLQGNGHRFLYIKTLSFGMVIDSLCCIETLSVRMVVDS